MLPSSGCSEKGARSGPTEPVSMPRKRIGWELLNEIEIKRRGRNSGCSLTAWLCVHRVVAKKPDVRDVGCRS